MTGPADHQQPEDIDWDRFDRSARAFTEEGQQLFTDTHIGLIGAGGLSSIKAELFSRTGIGELTIVDPDTVETSNLNRLFGASSDDVGRPKVDVLHELVEKANPDTKVSSIQSKAEDAAEQLQQVDVIVAGVDQMSARMWLNQFAVRHEIPYVDAGVVINTDDTDTPQKRVDSLEGYIQFINPGQTACFSCLDRDDPETARIERLSDDELQAEVERGYIDETHLTPEPALAPLNGVIASKTALLVSKWVTGYAPPAHWIRFEDIGNVLTAINTTPSDACPVCGSSDYEPDLTLNNN